MNSYANKNSAGKETAVSQSIIAAKQLVDNRPKAVAQRQLKEREQSKEQVVQYMVDNRPKKAVSINGNTAQLRKAPSRGNNRRTYKLPDDVQTHIFTNANNGVGFHSIAQNPATLLGHVQQIDERDRDTQAYRADHLNNAGKVIQAGKNKSMFPDDWDRTKVVDVIERAFTNPDLGANAQTEINESGATEENNRDLPAIHQGKIRGKADGIKVEGIMGEGGLATAYPRIP